ncbi:MAG TPA: thioredoxin domain-containing protein [Chitinophagales bacterium]|nr:thioredoxin domain-containing protein [Chitinophagales bacterium]
MKNKLIAIAFFTALILAGCAGQPGPQNDTNLTAEEFAEKLNASPGAPLLDVRTPGEFNDGHLKNAVNIDWNGTGFDAGISALNKTEPVFVYCLSGARSHSAAEKMRSMGFKKVYELNGGIIKWRAANLPQEDVNAAGMNVGMYQELINQEKKVLVDFYAEWCGPCKKMAPYLEAMKTEMADSVIIVRIDAGKNQQLAKTLKIEALPTLLLYSGNKELWRKTGYIDRAELEKEMSNR